MAASSTEIANLALSHVGVAVEVQNVDTESTAEARAVRAFYEQARDEVLRAFPWPFATVIAALQLVTDYTAEITTTYPEYGYAYRYPADCLRLLKIRSGAGQWIGVGPLQWVTTTNTLAYLGQRVRTKIISDAAGALILADQTTPYAEYVQRVTDVSRFAPDFVSALSFYLAALIAPRVTGGDPNNLGAKALAKYDLARRQAWATALNEQALDDGLDAESGFTAARA